MYQLIYLKYTPSAYRVGIHTVGIHTVGIHTVGNRRKQKETERNRNIQKEPRKF